MALKKKTVVLNLAQLGNQKSDPKSLVPGSPTLVENAQFVKGSRIDKRFGYDSLNILQPLTYYVEYPGPSASSLDTDNRINMTFTGGGSLSVNLFVIFDNDADKTDTGAEWATGITDGFSMGIVDADGVLWVITSNGSQTIFGFADTDFWVIQSNLRNTGGTEKVTVQRNGFPSTIDDLATFAPYDVNNIAVYNTNNPSGWVKRYAAVGEDLQGLVGSEEHMLLLADQKVFSYSDTLDSLVEIGPHRPAEITLDAINEDGRPLQSTDCAHLDGITYYSHTEITTDPVDAFMAITAVDEVTGERIYGPLDIGYDEISTIRLLIFKGVLYAFYSSTSTYNTAGNLYGRVITSTGLGAEVLMRSDVWQNLPFPGGNFWDILNYADDRLVLAYPTSLTGLAFRHFDEDLIEYVSPVYTSVVADVYYIRLGMSSSGDRYFAIFGGGAGGANIAQYIILDLAGTVHQSVISVGADASPQLANVGAKAVVVTPQELGGVDGVRCYLQQRSNNFNSFEEGFGGGSTSWHLANDGTLTVSTRDKEGFGYEVISNGYEFGGNVYYLLYRGAPNDTSYFIGSWEGDNLIITAQVLYGRAPGGGSNYRPFFFNNNFTEISPGVARVSVITKDSLTTVTGVASIKVDFTSKDTFSSEPYGKSLLIAGTNLHSFCGNYFRELGFFHIPRTPILVQAASGGQIPAGDFGVVVAYEFTDRNGYLHRSAPSPAATVTIASGTANKITADVECYNITNLSAEDTLVALITYRTLAGGSIFYRDTYYDVTDGGAQSANPDNQKNFTTAEINEVVMTRSDEELGAQATLYTTSGEIPPSPIPPVKYLTTWGSRIWAAGSARDEAIYFSKINQINLIPEFSEGFSISVQDKPGRSTGIKGLTDKIVLSKRGRLFFSYGDGPNILGEAGSFANFEEIPGVSGAISGRSMVVNSAGINYRSDNGVYTLTPGLETEFSGAPYEDAVDEEILAAITPIDSETLRFITATGILSYNNFFNAWSKDSSAFLVPVDAALYNNRFHVLTATNLLRENLNKWTDGETSYDILVETGWISFSGLAGFQRFYKLFIVMDNLTPYNVKVSLAYDYGDYESETTYADVTDSRIIIYPSKQKCEAFRFKIEATGVSGTEQSLNINFVAVEAGVKQGLPKQLPVAQRIGVTTI